jgi:uncharacterized protein (TIRG00374 family)
MIRRVLFWILILLFIWLVISKFDEIKMVALTLVEGKPGWILLAAVLVVIYNLVYAVSYKAAFAAADVHLPLSTIIPVMLASLVIGVTTPGGSATGLAVYVDDAARRGQSAARTAVGLLLQLIADFSSLTLVVGIGAIYLHFGGMLDKYTLLGGGAILIITACLVGVALMGVWCPGCLRRIFHWFQRLANSLASKFKRPAFLEEDWAEKNVGELLEAASAMTRHPTPLLLSALMMLTINVIDIIILKTVFTGFNYPVGIGPLVAGFSMGTLASVISPAPQGVGVVEGTMLYVFHALGIPWETNLTVSLAYRGLTFWLPLIVGMALLRRVKTFQVSA